MTLEEVFNKPVNLYFHFVFGSIKEGVGEKRQVVGNFPFLQPTQAYSTGREMSWRHQIASAVSSVIQWHQGAKKDGHSFSRPGDIKSSESEGKAWVLGCHFPPHLDNSILEKVLSDSNYSWLPVTRTFGSSKLALTRTKIDFPRICSIHLL